MIDIRNERSVRRQATTSGIRVFKIDPVSDPRWGAFVCAHPQASIFHHPAWIQALEAEYKQPAEHLACERGDGELLAILPLLRTRGLPLNFGGAQLGPRLASLPRTPVAGPLSIERRATLAVLQEAVALTAHGDGISLQIKAATRELDGLINGLVCTPWRYTYVLQLPPASEGPFRVPAPKEHKKIRWGITKAAKLGLTIRTAETEQDLRDWYRVYLQNMRHLSVPPRSFRFFSGFWTALRHTGMMELLMAEFGPAKNRRVIAGSVFLSFGNTVFYSFSGMDRAYASLRANDAILSQAINTACARGFELFDFGEVPDGCHALAKFKTKWGARPERLYRYFSPAPNSSISRYHSDSGSLADAIWRRLPLKVTELIGDKMYSFL